MMVTKGFPTFKDSCHTDDRKNLGGPICHTDDRRYLRELKLVYMTFIYKQHHYYVYIVTNPERTVLYTGVTNNLSQRLTEHWANKGQPKTFAGKYYCYNLIYYEYFTYINNAIAREKIMMFFF